MFSLDPVIDQAFNWCRGIPAREITGDIALHARFRNSYFVDPDYEAPTCKTTDVHAPGLEGNPSVQVRVYEPEDAPASGLLVWSHGGGWTGGSLDQLEADGVAREVCARANACVVSVGYRLADGFQTHYPMLHHDVLAAFLWAREYAGQINVAPDQVQLGGASAGANLSLSAVLEAIALDLPLPAAMQLIYPLLHRELPAFNSGYLDVLPDILRIPQPIVSQMVAAYLGPHPDASFFELGNEVPEQLPPSLVAVSEFDDLRPSGEAFAQQVQAAGKKAEVYLAQGMVHGHLSFSGSVPGTAETLQVMADYLTSSNGN